LISCEPSRFIEEVDSAYLDYQEGTLSRKKSDFDHERSSFGQSGFGNKFIPKKKEVNVNSPNTPSIPPRKNLVRMTTSLSKNSTNTEIAGDDTRNLQVEMRVEHGRFGTGVVKGIEGTFPNQKAIILFEGSGEKTLILKFAKLKILEN
jgi:DNA helicase-2/ATP-dependent DNA helicase PcrA